MTAAIRRPGTPKRAQVWIVNQYAVAPDRPGAAGSRAFDLARAVVGRGDRVTIFAAGVSHLSGREERLRRGQLYRIDTFDGVRFVWLRTFPYLGNTWRRPINMITFVVAFLVVQTRLRRPDVVVGSTVHPFAALGAWLATRLRRARFVFEIRDLWPQTLVDIGALRMGSPGERLLRRIEAHLVRRASVVITLLPGMRQYLAEQGLPSHHVAYIPNGVDLEVFNERAGSPIAPSQDGESPLDVVDRLHAEGRFVVGYVGTFGRVNGIGTLLGAVRVAEQRMPGRVALVLVGDGPERGALVAEARGMLAVAVCSAVPRAQVPAILRALDATILHATATPVFRYGMSPNKLFEYMAVGRPVVFACDSAYDPVAQTGAGITVPPNDPEAIAEAMITLAITPAEARRAMGAAGRSYVARYHDLRSLGEAFAAVVEGRPGSSNRSGGDRAGEVHPTDPVA
jgi:glycosyltransferase involved in cell wall biosynthesis